MKKFFLASLFCCLPFVLTSCLLDELCENEAQQIRITPASGSAFYIDKYEASRSNATNLSAGTGLTLACNTQNTVPWGNVTYEDARNACLDAGKRLCTKDEWRAACGSEYFPYGSAFDTDACATGLPESALTGAYPKCVSASGVFDMSGNLREWVEGGILMGGAFSSTTTEVRCSDARNPSDALSYTPTRGDGFRCCQDINLL